MSAAQAAAKKLSHEEVFLERYDQLLKWASQLTRPDRELARDLVQESFLQFSLSTGDLATINNIDNYLYGVVRNTYLSYLRRTPRRLHLPFDLEVRESIALTIDPRDQLLAKDNLIAICQRACVRKETSIAASLLILRFFHGYLPYEIAKLTSRSRNVVDVQLKLARWEVNGSADNRSSAAKTDRVSLLHSQPEKRSAQTGDLMSHLRRLIFATRRGECFDKEQITRLQTSHKPISRSRVSHLVSCPYCLDEANRVLGLSSLQERNVLDFLGRAKVTSSLPMYRLLHSALFLISTWTTLTLISFSDLVG